MKRFFIFLLVLFSFSLLFSDNKSHKTPIDSRKFISDINSALVSESADTLMKTSGIYLTKLHESNTPNCFGCSLYLIKSTENASPEIQLAAADLAVKFSRDFPEPHHHYFTRLVQFSPTSIGKIFSQFVAAFKTSFYFAFSASIAFILIRNLSIAVLIFFAFFTIVMILKYTKPVIHNYKHLVGFSRFYSVSFALTFLIASWIITVYFHNIAFVMIPIVIFFNNIILRSEKVFMHIALFMFIILSALSILVENGKRGQYDQDIAYNNLLAVISPDLISEKDIDLTSHGGNMARGFLHLYNHNFSRAVFNLKKELPETNSAIKPMILNALGVALASNANHKEAATYLQEAYEITQDSKIGYNLSKVLYQDGFKEESAKLEKKLLKNYSIASLSYPDFYFADISELWHYLCYGKESIEFNQTQSIVYTGLTILFYLFVLLTKYGYFGSTKVSRCLECGRVMCSKCNSDSGNTCAVCKLMKADYTLFRHNEWELYEYQRESFFKRRSIVINFATLLLPGSGLLFLDKTFEGSLYFAVPSIISTYYLMNNSNLVIQTKGNLLMQASIISLILLFYFISIIRTLVSIRRG